MGLGTNLEKEVEMTWTKMTGSYLAEVHVPQICILRQAFDCPYGSEPGWQRLSEKRRGQKYQIGIFEIIKM